MLVAAFSSSRRATMFAVWHPANKGCAVFFCTQVMHWANFSNGASRENNENKDFANEACQ